jgi:glycosyltransferase involved in cell wall biosynthesis
MPSSVSALTSRSEAARTLERIPVTVIIPTRDEAHQIADTLASLEWADEVIVVDGGSTDQTACIATEHGATVLRLEGGTIAAQRNLGIEQARNEWVLALDADERPSGDLIAELAAVVRSSDHQAYRIQFHNFYGERELVRGHWARDWHVRLFRRQYRFLDRQVHERLENVASVGTLRGFIRHASYRDFDHHLQKVVRYAHLGADELRARGYRVTVWHLLVKPAWRFFREYIVYGSFRDGRFGVVTSAMSALSAFLKYAFVAMPVVTRSKPDSRAK